MSVCEFPFYMDETLIMEVWDFLKSFFRIRNRLLVHFCFLVSRFS